MLTINTNLSSLVAQSSLKTSTNKLNQAIERMTSGYKINHAKDNAANFSISTNMSTKISALQIAEDNANMGLDMLNTSSEILSQMEDNLMKIRALAVQAQNGTYGSKSLRAMNSEAQALMNEISRLNETAQYNGIKLFNTGKENVSNKAKELKLNEQGFLKEVIVRDTSTMTKLSSIDETQMLAKGTYSISTKEELLKMVTMLKNKLVENGTEFVLGADIDLDGIQWVSTTIVGNFDGNGYTIKNLTGTNGLFTAVNGKVQNLRLENVLINSKDNSVGGIASSFNYGGTIDNCSVTGKINSISDYGYCGGIVGNTYGANPKYCYADVDINVKYANAGGIAGFLNYAGAYKCLTEGSISGKNTIGGIVGHGPCGNSDLSNCASYMNLMGTNNVGGIAGNGTTAISNCYYNGSVSGISNVGGIIGNAYVTSGIIPFSENIVEGKVLGNTQTGVFIGNSKYKVTIRNSYYYKKNLGQLPLCGAVDNATISNVRDITIPTEYNLQIGMDSDSKTSIVTLTTYVDFSDLSNILQSGLEDKTVIAKIDDMVNKFSLKQTEIGAVQNRLMSVLDEISIKYDNLISSRSTLRDADIAELSSTYIQQQILQQASATLLATANKSPSVALQLL